MEDLIYKKCEVCDNLIEIRIITDINDPDYGQPYVKHRKKRFCSRECLNIWQRNVKWEDRVGEVTADWIRSETSKRVSGDNNPTKNKETAKKVSESLKKYLKDNPRLGELNPMFGKPHTDEYKKWAIESREGKRSYDEEQYQRQKEKTPKGENHPNWLGGISNSPYPFEFDKKLKKKIKDRDGHKCLVCDKKTQKISIHHIDYNKDNIDEKNLISLCVKCHSISNYNREHWILFFNNKINEMYKIV